MKTYKPAIYVTAYKRHLSLKRLLNSLNNAVYPHKVNLIISLDGGHTEEVRRCAESFQFRGGEKTIVKHDQNLGLRKHILWCGDKVHAHEAIILLEDDLIVAPLFYVFAKQCLSFYHGKQFVAGISLYAQAYNEYTNTPFSPLEIDYDQYFMQVPSSWGQAWSVDHWAEFRKWYEDNSNPKSIELITNLPNVVKKWPESSWKKYFSAYLTQSNKFFVYPYRSLTSNCADIGGFHSVNGLQVLQVPLYLNSNINHHFRLTENIDNTSTYDAFMEPICDFLFDGKLILKSDLHIDIHNIKPINLLKERKYAITSKSTKERIIEIPLQFKPVEINLLHYQKTEEILTCHLTKSENIQKPTYIENKKHHLKLTLYYESHIIEIKHYIYILFIKIIKKFHHYFFNN